MTTRTWVRAALPPLFALTAVLAGAMCPRLGAQAGVNDRTLFVSALDRKGVPVPDLGPDAFVVKEDGARREVLRVSRASEPIGISVLIDNSQAANDAVTYIRRELPAFIKAVTPANQVSLVSFSDRPTILTPFTTDTNTLLKRADSIFSLRNTGATFLDAVFEVSQGFASRDVERAAIVAIVVDGTEFTNRYSKDVIAEMKKAGVALHLIAIGTFELDPQDHAVRERSLLVPAGPRETGGALYTMLSPNGIGQSLEKIARDLTSQYKVVYSRPERTVPPQKIEVETGREGLTVRGTPARTRKGA
jgi:VWFA-related protein